MDWWDKRTAKRDAKRTRKLEAKAARRPGTQGPRTTKDDAASPGS
jgi:hypothetical protein